MNNKPHWAVIGGGIMGMMTAHRLRQQGYEVTIYEAAQSAGGLASAWQLGDYLWDRFYHVILLSDKNTRGLLAEIGLENETEWRETKTGFYTDGQLYSMSNSLEFLRFPPLTLLDKFRLGLTILYASRLNDWKKLEGIHVEEWLRKWSGDGTFEKIWLPLLRAKLGENYKRTSAAFIWATIQRMYAARNSGMKKEMFGYVRGGYARILDRFTEHLRTSGVQIKTGYITDTIQRNGRFQLTFKNGEKENADRVVVTIPSGIAAHICPDLSDTEHQLLKGVEYLGVVCPSVILKKSLSPYYVTNITDDWVPFTGVIEMTSLVDKEQFGGNSLIYLPKYVRPDHPLFDKSKDEIKDDFIESLKKMYPELSDSDVEFFGVSRARNVFALPTLHYSENLAPIRTSVDGLYILNSAQIVNGTLNINETIGVIENNLPAVIKDAKKLDE